MAGGHGAALKGIREGGGAARITLFLLLLLALLLVFLVAGEKPWNVREGISARLAEGKDPTLEQHVAVGLYWAAALNAGLCLLLLASARWWARDLAWENLKEDPGAVPGTRRLGSGLFWIVLTGAVVSAGVLRWNLAHRSLWWDELWCVKQAIVGRYDPIEDESADLRFREAGLDAALWYYKKPTNHNLHSTLSNIAVRAWQKLGGKDQNEFSDLVVRLPACLAGVASILGIGILLRRWGYDLAGVAAAWLLALHPLHVRYGIDARAYSLTVLFTILGCLALSALYFSRGRSWRPWLCFGLTQFLVVWNFLHAVWVAAGFFLVAVVIIRHRSANREARIAGLIRLVFVNVLAAMTFLQVFAPNYLQMRKWIVTIHEADAHLLGGAIFRDTLAQLFFGMHWAGVHGIKEQEVAGILDRIADETIFSYGVMALTAVLLLVGTVQVWRRRRILAVILLSILVAGIAHMTTAYLAHHYFYERFVIHLLVPLVAALGLGLERVARIARRGAGNSVADLSQFIPVLVYVGAFAWFGWPHLILLQTRAYAPMRDVAEFLEARNAESDRGIVVLGYGLGGDIMRSYYPRARFVRSLEEIEHGCAIAKEAGRPLYLFYGYSSFNRATLPDGFSWIDDPEEFAEVGRFAGIEPDFFFRVLRWVGGGGGVRRGK